VIVIDSVSVQPFAPVTVTVYVPAEVNDTEAVVPKELLQLYVPPPVAATSIEVCVQVKTVVPVLLVIPAVGGATSCVIVIDSVSVQPLAPVTVTVYVPAEVNDTEAEVPKELLQLYVPPPVAVTVIVVVAQVNTVVPVEFIIPATGNDGSEVIVIDSVSVHPLAPVTVTV